MSQQEVASEVTSTVWKIEAKMGDRVTEGQVIMILESMKMEIPVAAPCSGTIVTLLVKEQDNIEVNQVIATIDS